MNLRLPSNWRTLGFVQKAAYLCSTRQAATYSEACSMLARLPRKPKPRDLARPSVAQYQAGLEKRGLA